MLLASYKITFKAKIIKRTYDRLAQFRLVPPTTEPIRIPDCC